MADVFSSQKRSEIMSKVRSVETKPEIAIRKLLFSQGFRYRKNVKYLLGVPDIVLLKYKTIIFVHGCFWHGHKNCKASALPKSRIEYWYPKIQKNINRDKRNKRNLKKLGWRVIIVWECDIKKILCSDSKEQKMLINLIKQVLN